MTKTKSSHGQAGKNPAKKGNNKAQQRRIRIYCPLCRTIYFSQAAQVHMHGMLHHRELESVLGEQSFHDCQACMETFETLNEYAQHISTAQHKAALRSLISKKVKPLSLIKTLGVEIMNHILERNKKLKLMNKANKKKKKTKRKRKESAGPKCTGKLQAPEKRCVVSRVVKPETSKQVNKMQRKQDTRTEGPKNAVVQNKENKVSIIGGAGQTREQPRGCHQFIQSSHQLWPRENFSVSSHCSKVITETSKTDRCVTGPQKLKRCKRDLPIHMTWPALSNRVHANKQCNRAKDITSDDFSPKGAINFDHGPNEHSRSSQLGRDSSHSSSEPASANKCTKTATPTRESDISATMRQVRRALGLREPCRADREAQRQNSAAGGSVDQARAEKKQPAGDSFTTNAKKAAIHIISAANTSGQSTAVSSYAPASHPSVPASVTAPAEPQHAAVKSTQGPPQHCERSSVVASDKSEALDSLGSLSQCLVVTTSSKSDMSRKVWIAHKPGRVQGESGAGLKPALGRFMNSLVARRKLSSREKQKVESKPRFGIELANLHPDTSAHAEDLTLSEGFHWESVPHNPPEAHRTGLPPQPQDTTRSESPSERRSDAQVHKPLELPGQTVKAVSVKVETNLKDQNGDLRDHSRARKRKEEVVMLDDVSDDKPRGKKKKKTKTNQDQDQLDELLAVSMKEEELSHSFQDLDVSLMQARSALQAAYTEVHRLLLLKQQFTAEVNSLRVLRIEILRGMQGGSSGTESASATSAGGATASGQLQLSPLPSCSALPSSSSQGPPHTYPASGFHLPHPTTSGLPAVLCQAPAHSCNPEEPQAPENQPVPLFRPDLFKPLLFTSATPSTSVSSPRHLSSTSVNASPESSAQRQKQVSREGLHDCVKTVSLLREEADGDSKESVKKPVPTFVCEGAKSTSTAATDKVGGDRRADSVAVMQPSNVVVIVSDEPDIEEVVPIHQEPPRKSVSVELSSPCKQNDAKSTKKPEPTPVKDASALPELADLIEDEEPSLGQFEKHQGPVFNLQVHSGLLYTCSWDNTARAYSLMSRECQAVFKGHTDRVNCLVVSPPPTHPACLFTGSSDQTICCYSLKSQKCLEQISLSDRVLCLHIAWNTLFAGLANGLVASYDLKTLKQLDVFECHGSQAVNCLGTTQEGARRVLLVGSCDSAISVRDAKSGLFLRSLNSHSKNVLCLKVVNDLVFIGSSDGSVHAHNIHTGELVQTYKGHSQAVTSIVILGMVMLTSSLDHLVRVYDLQSHDCLQVYGGHSHMVMCMAVHNNVIYTGCYDGSIQAVKLNLTKSHRCWWQSCSLIFGMEEHLVQHLVRDHTNPNQETVKCRWRGCNTFFTSQRSVRQELPEHMQSHVKNDSQLQR